ncbi:MAG: septum formation initiator family protein [Thermodesulfovibrionales bacterium]
MRRKPRNLREQVALIKKRNNIIFYSTVSIVIIYLICVVLLGDMGLIKYTRLTKTALQLESEIRSLEDDNRRIRSEVKALKEDPYFIEKHAREEFGLARKDEYIFLFQPSKE